MRADYNFRPQIFRTWTATQDQIGTRYAQIILFKEKNIITVNPNVSLGYGWKVKAHCLNRASQNLMGDKIRYCFAKPRPSPCSMGGRELCRTVDSHFVHPDT